MSNFQIIKTKNELDRLLQDFLKKRDEGFVFRGHADFSWELKPKLFRDSEVVKSWESYGLSKKHIAENWIENKNTFITLSYIFGSQNLTKTNYKSALIPYKDQIIPLARLLWFYVDIMKYNYNLYKYINENKSYYEEEYLKQITVRSLDDWISYDTFLRLLEEILYLVERRDVYTNNLLNNPEIFEDIAAYDETRPQHYDMATSALDWTYNPFIALFFACGSLANANSSRAIVIYPSTQISLFLYKQISTGDNVSVILKKPSETIVNDRAKRQEGVFTWMPKARSFYLTKGNYPKLEDYRELINKEFILEEYRIEINDETATYIQE
ncbi:TPA: FRG domain-containing protein, partial [Legionella pneumophila]|nr:FRG domain-containing protein [Legionella pneumophila]